MLPIWMPMQKEKHMDKENRINSDSVKEAILEYVKKSYKGKIEYLWKSSPNSGIFRHDDNRKWYALIMDIPKSKLGLSGQGDVWILNVKTNDHMLHDILLQQKGYYPGYHMNKGHWISIILDGTVPFDEICDMVDMSYQATASKEIRAQTRPPKEWIVPANPKYYDIEHAFDAADTIDWKQGKGIKAKDTVFLYVAAPISAVLYKCKVLETDIPYNYQDNHLTIKSLMKLKLLKRYQPHRFTFEQLRNKYGISAVRGPRSVPGRLSQALKK